MNLEQVKSTFDQTVLSSVWWQRFKGSEFVEYLSTFVAQIGIRANAVAERSLQESFISQAITPSAILAHAQSKGYVPLKRRPTIHQVQITNSSDSDVSFPSDTVLYSPDSNLFYYIEEAMTISANSSQTATCIQGEKGQYSATIETLQKHTAIELDKTISEQISSFDVHVTEPDAAGEKWQITHLFRNTNQNTLAYVEYYNATEQIGIRFGNGISGKIPKAGSRVDVDYVLTQGYSDLPNGALLEFDEYPVLNSSLSVSIINTQQIGLGRESIESIRQNAQYFISFDNNLVLDNDYPFFIRQNLAGLTWVSVWGEKGQEALMGAPSTDYINQIYISAYHPLMTQEEVKSAVAEVFTIVKPMNESYVMVDCVEAPYTITLNGKTRSTNIPNDVKQAVIDTLNDHYSSAALSTISQTTINDIYKKVEQLGLLYDFSITVQGADFDTSPPINTFRYMDVLGSTINVTY